MRVKVLLQITDDDGAGGTAVEVTAFEKVTERLEDLGLSIAEGKALLAAIQQRTVTPRPPHGCGDIAVARHAAHIGAAKAVTP